MNVFNPTLRGALKIPGYINPEDIINVEVYYGAPPFAAASVYRIDDIVRPSIDNGYYYKCTVSGIVGDEEPDWDHDEVETGTAVFKAYSYDLYVLPSQHITASEWESPAYVTLTNEAFNSTMTSATMQLTSTTVSSFTLTNHITKSNGETLSRTFKYDVNPQ